MRFRGLIFIFLVTVLTCASTDHAIGNSNSQAAASTASEDCLHCHEGQYTDWAKSGHRFILMTSEDAQNRPLPLPRGGNWEDISYVVGGYRTKALYLDTDGYFITKTLDRWGQLVPGRNQYNLLPDEWSDYHAGTENLPYNCGSCHTTNWVANENPEDLSGNQDGLPGIHGTFDQAGIQCIQCHGGEQHADIGTIDRSAEACGACHHRTARPGDENIISASGGFIQSRQQYNEHLAGPHADSECVYCHDPHKRSDLSIKEDTQCGDSCHVSQREAYSETKMYESGVTCDDCHMPYASLSAIPSSPSEGDLKTHVFFIDTEASANMFTEDGQLVQLDDEGKAAVTLDFVCQRCHQGWTMEDLALVARDFHSRLFVITGSIENRAGEPLADVGIELLDGDGFFLSETRSNANGAWRSLPQPSGSYFVVTENDPSGYNRELYDNHLCLPASQCDEPAYVVTHGTPLQIEGDPIAGIDFRLDRGIVFRDGFE